ncbi:MAG: hypothetical protein ABIR24_13515, partial [Verrucomicrobiota bacterium]
MKTKIQKILHSIRAHRIKILAGFAVLVIGFIGSIVGANQICQNAAKNKIFHSVESVPQSDVGLVLGTG